VASGDVSVVAVAASAVSTEDVGKPHDVAPGSAEENANFTNIARFPCQFVSIRV